MQRTVLQVEKQAEPTLCKSVDENSHNLRVPELQSVPPSPPPTRTTKAAGYFKKIYKG